MQTKKEREKPAPQQTQKLSLPRRQTATLKSECRRTVATERDDSGLRPMQVCGVGPEPERPGPPSMQGQATERALHQGYINYFLFLTAKVVFITKVSFH